MVLALLIIAGLVLLADLSLIVLWQINYKNAEDGISDTPFVSVLIAARNEEDNLADCLESILAVDYPKDRFEILVGDDKSEDQTGELAYAFSIRYPQVKSYTIYKQKIQAMAKPMYWHNWHVKLKGNFYLLLMPTFGFHLDGLKQCS